MVLVSVEGPGRETREEDLCSSALESLMEDLVMDPENGLYRCCCCCPAEPCRGQIDGDRQLLVCHHYHHFSFSFLTIVPGGPFRSRCHRLVPPFTFTASLEHPSWFLT
ncbi:hypothetical protein B0H65DRAFT_465190 [Neurospora tetraspora]|uniref:Uncharacterized protein n=1 Tax=Neurospora tetraspora TaxID=94610 RepID=A0AAE0MRV1_9PEZI|nr:hypothetical protein B0H65DRAFT_465190 [Neurospora tetraspora]